jgi:isopropylmalate/homocitrate/citramalate synthase
VSPRERVTVVEVGPRDGLQNEKGFVPTDVKVAFVEALGEAGLPVVETTAFVSPRAIPQLADSAEVFARVRKRPGTRYPVLVPNEKGMLRALSAGAREVALFTAATDTFNVRNTNVTVEGSFVRFAPVVALARAEGIRVRGYVSTAFGCPYEGPVAPEAGVRVAERLLELGCDEISIGDTIGVGTPGAVHRWLAAATGRLPIERLAMHFHDTRGQALANVLAALERGVRVFDASAGGLGGCPYAPGASGNLATEDLLYGLHGSGWWTGVDLQGVIAASRQIAGQLDHGLPGRVFQAERVRGVPEAAPMPPRRS